MEDFQKNILKVRIFSNTVIFQVIVKIFFKVIHVKRAIIPIKLVLAFPFSSRLSKAVSIKLWWSEIPTSITSVFLKKSFLFVKIRSMQVGFEYWKQFGFFIKQSRSNVVMTFSRLFEFSPFPLFYCHSTMVEIKIDLFSENLLGRPPLVSTSHYRRFYLINILLIHAH